jgi:predicted ATP-grasp superfamily ATP-dependent carboligase
VLALAPDRALKIAGDKERTLAIARELGIAYPKSARISEMDDLAKAIEEFGFPLVIKPTISWAGQPAARIVPVEVVSEEEARGAVARFLAMNVGVLAQQWACGRREGVSLFIVNGEVVAKCGHVAYRTNPAMGGVSVMRESIPVPPDILDPAVRLSTAVGMEGVCEVEFRRDADNRPLLMEINPRLAGTIENAIRSGVDLPLMIWQWATGDPVRAVSDYRTGVRTRWLQGDLRWLMENQRHAGRPDTVSRIRSFWVFATEFARTRYYDYLDWDDVKPALAEFRCTMTGSWRVLARK